MEKLIIVEVSIKTQNPKEPFKKVFSKQVPLVDGLVFPYHHVIDVLSLLFGIGSVVTFSVHNNAR